MSDRRPEIRIRVSEADTVNVWEFSRAWDDRVFAETLEQSGETYRVSLGEVPEHVIRELNEMGLEVIDG